MGRGGAPALRQVPYTACNPSHFAAFGVWNLAAGHLRMRDAMVGSMIVGLIICALCYAAVTQSAAERYPDRNAGTSLLIWRDIARADRYAPSRDTHVTAAYRDGWRAGWHAARP